MISRPVTRTEFGYQCTSSGVGSGPSENRERPERTGKPRIERIRIAPNWGAAVPFPCDDERLVFGFGDDRQVVRRVPNGQLMAPPHLPRNVPVLDVFEREVERAPEALGDEANAPVAMGRKRRRRERLHLAKPLQREQRFDDGAAARTDRNGVAARDRRDERPGGFQVARDGRARLEAVETRVLRRIRRHLPIEPNDARHRQAVAFADRIVRGIVRGRDLYGARAEIAFHRVVRDHRYRTAHERNHHALADERRVAFVARMHGDRRIAEHRFRARRRHFDRERTILRRVANLPEEPVALFVVDFGIGERRLRNRIPVDQPRAAVNQTLAIQRDEHFDDRSRKRRIHRKTVARPVRSETEFAERFVNRVAVLLAPTPRACDERAAPESVAREPFLREFAHENGFGRDRGVILARQPIRVLALHAMKARQDIHRRVGRAMPEMRAPRDVRRRHRNDERRPRRVRLLVEDARGEPGLVDAGLDLAGFVRFRECARSRFGLHD